MPVILKSHTNSVKVLAFLDDSSDVSLVDSKIIQTLGLKCSRTSMSFNGLNDTRLEVNVLGKTNFLISGVADLEFCELKGVYAIKYLKLPTQSLDQATIQKYQHLKGLNLNIYDKEIPRILLGQDNVHLIVSRKVRSGATFEPVASLTRLGWVVHGHTPIRQPGK